MIKFTLRLVISSLAMVVAIAGRASASAIQFDFSSVVNTDVIINLNADPPTAFDETNQRLDEAISHKALLTQSAAALLFPSSPNGLPDNGFFAANADHPDVQLLYRDSDSGNNARQSAGADSYTVSVPSLLYSSINLFATSGSGDSLMSVALNYSTGPATVTPLTVSDWFSNPPAGTYALIDGLDRADPTAPFAYQNANTAAIFGFRLVVDSSRVLNGFTVTRLDNPLASNEVLNVFGGTGVALDIPTDPAPAPVPEPGTLSLFGAGALLAARRVRTMLRARV